MEMKYFVKWFHRIRLGSSATVTVREIDIKHCMYARARTRAHTHIGCSRVTARENHNVHMGTIRVIHLEIPYHVNCQYSTCSALRCMCVIFHRVTNCRVCMCCNWCFYFFLKGCSG